jgi:hypothetical protein
VNDCTANYRPILSSERASYMKKKENNCQTKKIKIWQCAPKEADTKTNWPTDRWSQYNFFMGCPVIEVRFF